MRLTNLNIPLNIVLNGANTLLLGVTPYYEYVDGKKTENLLGYKYTVVEDQNYEKFSVKIESKTPSITQQQIDDATARIKVTFEKAFARPYRTNSGDYDLSVTATGINLQK